MEFRRVLVRSHRRAGAPMRRACRTGLEQLAADMGKLVAWAHLRGGGRQGAASVDEMIDAGRSISRSRDDLIEVAETCARQVTSDWKTFCTAYDAGAFALCRGAAPCPPSFR